MKRSEHIARQVRPAGEAGRFLLILVTCATMRQARAIARALVGEHLAACANILGPMRSIYRWRGTVEDQREYLMIIKARAEHYVRLEERVRALHDYEVPEILALKLRAGSRGYLSWLLEATAEVARTRRTR